MRLAGGAGGPGDLRQSLSFLILGIPSTHGRFAGANAGRRFTGMFVSPAFSVPVFFEREDRRKRNRFAYPAIVRVDGRPARGRDMSAKGASVLLTVPKVGDIVTLTLSQSSEGPGEITAQARVVRIDHTDEGQVIGLEFLE